MNDDQGDGGETTTYAEHMFSIYKNALFMGQLPPVTTNPNLLESKAREVMSEKAFNYVYGGAGEMATTEANRLAFRQWKLIPRFLRSVAPRDLRVELFGHKYASPVVMAPIGVQGIAHEDKELGVASICSELGVPYTLSTAATSTIEEVAEASGDGPRWFQLYWPKDNDITASLLSRAKASGYQVLVVTLDTFSMSWRPLDLDTGYLPFLEGIGNAVGFSDPVFRRKFNESSGDEVEDSPLLAASQWLGNAFPGDNRRWEDLQLLKKQWDGPIVLKGIQSVKDAELAHKAGVSGIIVSNHGGRQLDGAIGSLEVLPEIVDAVGDKMTVLFDSGIRTGVDIVKALALGAKAVLVGRPVIYGLGVAGKEGAKSVLAGLLADLDQSMGLAGIKSVKDLDRSILRQVRYGGDLRSNM